MTVLSRSVESFIRCFHIIMLKYKENHKMTGLSVAGEATLDIFI